jgi:isopenicillin N synthase-like dioxygenase
MPTTVDKGIPAVDLSKYVNGNEAERAEFVQEIGAAFTTVGFVAVRNHGVSQELIDNFYAEAKSFFALPEETKRAYENTSLAGQRGYTSFGKEHAKQSNVGDLKEFFQIGQTVAADNPRKSQYPDNIVVAERPSFSQLGDELYKAFEKSGAHLLRSIATYLNLGENYFDDKITDGNSILRAIHYPPITGEPNSAIRAEQHEDINLITLLVGASAGGLQVMKMDGSWKDINVDAGELVINVGDMLQRLANNRLKSTTHRVINPPREQWHLPRLSIPFFLHPISEMDLTCLENCIDEAHPLAYEPITAGEYLDERLREIGLKK